MATLNDHGENLTNLVFLMTVQVPQNIGVELQDHQIVTTDQAGNKAQHEQLDLVFIVRLLKFAEKSISVILRII